MKRILTLTLLLLTLSRTLQAQQALTPGVQEFSLNAVATAAPQVGTAWGIPAQVNIITWIISFASAPASQTSILEFSNDNSTWATGDTSTNVNGEARTIFSGARFLRVTESARTGGGAITVTVIGKGSGLGFGVGLYADGTAGAPSISFASTPGIGFYRNSSISVGLTGNLTTSSSINAASDVTGRDLIAGAARNIYFTGKSLFTSTADKLLQTLDNGGATGLENSVGTPALGVCTAGTLTSGSHNFAGEITGNTSSSCILNFGVPNFTNAPICIAMSRTSTTHPRISAVTSASITITGGVSGEAIGYHCFGRIGT